jgi:hypothetical protein
VAASPLPRCRCASALQLRAQVIALKENGVLETVSPYALAA